jgi:hypothetical protein
VFSNFGISLLKSSKIEKVIATPRMIPKCDSCNKIGKDHAKNEKFLKKQVILIQERIINDFNN